MSTSANVVEYIIRNKDGKEVGNHRYNVMCKPNFESLLKFEPHSEHTITPHGYDEDEEHWVDKGINLDDFLIKNRVKTV